jgi:hypothetical protein
MRIIDRLEKWLEPYAIANITNVLVIGQMAAYVAVQNRPDVEAKLWYIPALVLQGEVWRLFTFLFTPPLQNPICAFFFWYLFFLMGTSLEALWGAARYNLYLLIGILASIGASFVHPNFPVSNAFLESTVFLAFAFLNPDFELYIFFLLPVKVWWLAAITWLTYGFMFLQGDWGTRALVCGSVANFLFFFAPDIVQRLKTGRRHMAWQAHTFSQQQKKPYYHKCVVCGITDTTHPKMDFRYCSQCEGAHGYCQDHLRSHEHVKAQPPPP